MVDESRRVPRRSATMVHPVNLHRDRRWLSYNRSLDCVLRRIEQGLIFDIDAEVADTSEGGIRVRFRGQRLRAQGLLRRNERYWLKISARNVEAQTPQHLLRSDGDPHLLLRTICRWYRPGHDMGLSTAGFVLDPINVPELNAFVGGGFSEQVQLSAPEMPFGPT